MYATARVLADRAGEIMALCRQFHALSARRRELDLECARVLTRMAELDGWALAGSAGVGEFGERYAVPAAEARSLLDLGRAIQATPDLEEQVRTGRITVPSAALLGRVLPDPTLRREGDDWVGLAKSVSTKSLRRLVQKRIEETRIGEGLAVPVVVYVAEQTREDFRRAVVIASRKAGEFQSESQTFKTIVYHFLDDFDELRVTPGTRRLPHTALVNGRDVPESVKREVYDRQGQRCAIPFCEFDIYLNLAHLIPHAGGGHREADNLILLCWRHHDYFDHGLLRLTGTAAKPNFLDKQGRDLTHRFEYVFSSCLIDPESTVVPDLAGSLNKTETSRPEQSGRLGETGADPP